MADAPGKGDTRQGEDAHGVELAHMSDFMDQVLTRIAERERPNTPRDSKRRNRKNETTTGRDKRHKGDSSSSSDDEDSASESGSSSGKSTRSALGVGPIHEVPPRKRRLSDDGAEYPCSRKKPIREPAMYRGRSERDFIDLIDSCEAGFIQDKAALRTEADRVFWASQYLEKGHRDRWR